MVIALVGRRIDPPDLTVPVFPFTAVKRVRERIHDLLRNSNTEAMVCSAACGADLIALDAAHGHHALSDDPAIKPPLGD